MRCKACNEPTEREEFCDYCEILAEEALCDALPDDRGILMPYPRGPEDMPREPHRASDGITPARGGQD